MPPLELVSPGEHFKEKISTASKDLNLVISKDVEFYLVTLMCSFIKPKDGVEFDTPLALQLKAAAEAAPENRDSKLKWLGDTSLYLAGFFQDFFNKKTYDIKYYISMGSNAYLKLSETSKTSVNVYKDLAHKFDHLVEVVATVAEDIPATKDLNLLATYDRWTKTRSQRLRKILEEEGITPIEVNMSKIQ